MKYTIVIDYLTGQDESLVVSSYSLDGYSLIVEVGNVKTIYPLFNVKTVTITASVNNG